MAYFIALQYPYHSLTVTLAHNSTILATETITKFQATSLLIPTLQKLLQSHQIELSDICAIAVNNGPGPFNTLRSMIASTNAIAFARNIPLIACNGLTLLSDEIQETPCIALLDAFGQDVYFADKQTNEQDYRSIAACIHHCNNLYVNQTLHFIGNAAIKHKEYILQHFQGTAYIHETMLFAQEQTLVNAAYNHIITHRFTEQIYPLYFQCPIIKT